MRYSTAAPDSNDEYFFYQTLIGAYPFDSGDHTKFVQRVKDYTIKAIREALQAQRLPDAPNDARCRKCSLKTDCLPGVVGDPDRLRGLQGALFVPYGSVDADV